MFALEELVDFALGGGAAVDGCGVVGFGVADLSAGFADAVFWKRKNVLGRSLQGLRPVEDSWVIVYRTLLLNLALQRLNCRVSSQIVQSLARHKDV